jgi:hypothetical protein
MACLGMRREARGAEREKENEATTQVAAAALSLCHHKPPYCQNQEFNTGCGRSTHQNGPFHPLFQVNHGKRDSSVNSRRDRLTAWTLRGNCVRQRSSVCIQVLASSIRASWS